MELAIVIVTWNVRELVLDAIRTAQEDAHAHGLNTEFWVVDNASADGTAEAVSQVYPAVHLIANQHNLGFAAGNNLALRAMGFGHGRAPAELPHAVLLLNPDTLIHAGALRTLYEALFAAETTGLVGARLSYGDGSFQHSAFGFPGIWQTLIDLFPVPGRLYASRLNGRYPLQRYESREPFSVDHVLGATMMLRREVIEQTGMFDEQFFMYCEEIDWAMRIREAGWEILCVPNAHVTHLEGKSTGQVRPESYLNLWRSRFQLYAKHYSPLKVSLIRLIVRLGMRRKIQHLRSEAGPDTARQSALIDAYEAVARL
ncbi:MAG: glycosyltransferase family 2 protein [Anaerolineae bacterium]|nr:glycosyltransferase family 2 protein [Anaerolineae bacterium]